MDRVTYFENIRSVESPLLLLTAGIDKIMLAAANDCVDELLAFADQLSAIGTVPATTRAAFIKLQCKGINTEDLFEAYCESWGIPRFEEDLIKVDDFKNGFLWTFRDHTSSWSEDEEARDWFYTHHEARFARRYEYWGRDSGPEEMLLMESGDYKSMLWSIVKKHADYTPFISPVFSQEELVIFYDQFDEREYDFDIESLLQIMEQNPNWFSSIKR
jgi:hypothetical protein